MAEENSLLPKYVLVEPIVPFRERIGLAPTSDVFQTRPEGETAIPKPAPLAKCWLVRRRRDAKIFLGREFRDEYGFIFQCKESLLRLFNHPNLVCLEDIVANRDPKADCDGYAVWEYCNKGTLNRLLCPLEGEPPAEIPESLCWHILDGLVRALSWLHDGYKATFPYETAMVHDHDWQPVLVHNISPTKIFFCKPEGQETYGDVKLGGLNSVTINPSHKTADVNFPPPFDSKYHPPEIRVSSLFKHRQSSWTRAADIWSVGAVLCHVMTGSPPWGNHDKELRGESFTQMSSMKPLPHRYSTFLRDIVHDMLSVQRQKRPLAGELVPRIGAAISRWRDGLSEQEKAQFVRKGERRGFDARLEALSQGGGILI